MADLPTYSTLDEKRKLFSNGNNESFVINTKRQLDKWFVDVEEEERSESKGDATAMIYRGMSEAKYKLLTSSQRLWIINEMNQWSNKSYLPFIIDMVDKASINPLISKVFDLYSYSRSEREFPILSLLQHYGAPTPLMDWTYNSNVAFYFATEGLTRKEQPKSEIDDYFSICRINKRNYKVYLANIIDVIPENQLPKIDMFRLWGEDGNYPHANSIFYISDFERLGESKGTKTPFGQLKIRTRKPMTSIYNHNIIPQEGLFIFSPFHSQTLEEIFNPVIDGFGAPIPLKPFDCFNIKKDLAEYLKRKVDVKFKINKPYIFPNLNDEALKIKESAINSLIN